MPALDLWNLASQLKSTDYRWVNLTHTLSCDTPHWFGFKPFESTKLLDYLPGTPEDMLAPMRCFQYSVASQYGTHVDAPRHFHVEGRSLGEIEPIEFMHPLCVIDKHEECAANPDFILTIEDLKAWEDEHGRIPEDAFVAFRSDWSKLADLENKDEDGQPHYPGWDLGAIKWLVEERDIGAIGHEPADTDPASVTTREDAYPYPGEQYILSVDRYQIEVMDHLDELPATAPSSSAPSPRCVMASDIPHVSLRSAPRHKFPCVCSSKYGHPVHATWPGGIQSIRRPIRGRLFMGR